MTHSGLIVSAFCVLAAAPALSGDRLDGARLRGEVVGNTLSGFFLHGAQFSEYHAPDGTVLGHNSVAPVTDGCWSIRSAPGGDQMCYTYGRGESEITSCWFLERSGGAVAVIHPTRGLEGVAVIEPGNRRGHVAVEPWSCDRTISRHGIPDRLSARAVAP